MSLLLFVHLASAAIDPMTAITGISGGGGHDPTPGKGEMLVSLEVIDSPEHLQDLIDEDRVSLVLFTQGEAETDEVRVTRTM